MKILIIGGARSGKSSLAEEIARHRENNSGDGVIYIATARAGDEEMEARIAAHKQRRPDSWLTIEEELYPGQELCKYIAGEKSSSPEVVLLDCITLLVSNTIMSREEEKMDDSAEDQIFQQIMEEIDDIIQLADEYNFDLLFVSNEAGMGVVPPSKLGRLFRDISGKINRKIEDRSDRTYFMVAGKPIDIEEIAASPLEEDWSV